LVPNPCLLEVEGEFKILMYHGGSINMMIDEIPAIRSKYSHRSPTTVVKEFIKRRHLAPMHGKMDYIPCGMEDSLVMKEVPDPHYTAERENTLLIGYHCKKAEKYCFCGSLELKGKADLMFYEKKGGFLVEVLTKKGEAVLNHNQKLFKRTNQKIGSTKIKGTTRLKKKDISKFYDNSDWKKGTKECLSCAACNMHCPSCYCFNIRDEVNVHNLKEGERVRSWSGCQLKSFTRVAGEHVFREDRNDRFKHRIYHQLSYFKDRYGDQLCSGCGRCIRHCPTRIDFVKILNGMK